MIAFKQVSVKKIKIYLIALAVVSVVAILVVSGRFLSLDSLSVQIGNFISSRAGLSSGNFKELETPEISVLKSKKIQTLTGVKVEPINPAVGQKYPFGGLKNN